MPRVFFLLALFCLPLIVGCEGCRRDPNQQAEDEEKEEAPLEDFTARPAQAFPADISPIGGGIKPGHWMTASQSLKSNKIDARGELQSRSTATGTVSLSGEASSSDGELVSARPVVLPKGQQRRFDYRLLAPKPPTMDQKRILLSSQFVSSGRSVFFNTGNQPFNVLSGEEFFFVILTTRPQRFAKFQIADWVRPYQDEYSFKDKSGNYRIVFPPTKDLLPLAETMLDWSSTAVVLWDDITPETLTPQQQQALADWIRFGGQLIVNGAAASDAISKTSLADVLPLSPTSNIELDPEAGAELLRGWSVKSDPSTEKQIALLRSQSGRVAVDGHRAEDASAIADCGNLVLTRRVGIGRVVQPRFDLTADWVSTWESFDSFINAVVLARPRREFVEGQDETDMSLLVQRYADWGLIRSDAAINTQFRIAARDAVLQTSADSEKASSAVTSRIDPLTHVDVITGVGAWTDNSDVMDLARQILQSESGIEIPNASLVVRSLGYYLLILVPINYLVFRFVGRLEYAWLAVPLIAIGGAIWVARAARLDIGFARSQTEVAILETQPGYARGHLSRVVAIYNSLSSQYDIQFKTVDGAAAPIDFGTRAGEIGPIVFRNSYAEGPALADVAVGSNQIRMVHTEQIMDLGGPISLVGDDLLNQTTHELLDALVIEKTDADNIRVAVLGSCAPGSKVGVRFRNESSVVIPDDLPMQTARMVRRLAAPEAMRNGSTRLVARIDSSLPGMTITPIANQALAQTVVLAHLKHAPLAKPQSDVNLISEFRKSNPQRIRDQTLDQLDAPKEDE